MTLAEKASEMQNNSAAVPRLNIPAYQWWSEALHRVIKEGVTEYPEPIGVAATFDAPGIYTMAAQIGVERRIKHVQNLREGHTGINAISIGGGQPDTGAPGITGKVHVDGQYALPE